jgi:hypothetical protein
MHPIASHRRIGALRALITRPLALTALIVSAVLGSLLAGCFGLQPDEKPDAETTAAAQTIAKARAESGIQDQRVKEVEDMTATPTP